MTRHAVRGNVRFPRALALALALPLAALLAGCTAPDAADAGTPTSATPGATPTSEPSAADAARAAREEARARRALDAALAALHAPEGLLATVPGAAGYDSTLRASDPAGRTLTGTTTMRFGVGDTSEMRTTVEGKVITITCGSEGYVSDDGSRVELRRRVPNVTCAGAGASDAAPREGSGLAYLGTSSAEGVPRADAKVSFSMGAGGTLALTLDAGDRLLQLDIGNPSSSASYRLVYGDRDVIPLPAWDSRAPAKVRFDVAFRAGELSLLVRTADERPLLSELELRVTPGTNDTIVATFRLDAREEQRTPQHALVYEDRDGDERASPGDLVTITSPYWIEREDYRVALFDHWAGKVVPRG